MANGWLEKSEMAFKFWRQILISWDEHPASRGRYSEIISHLNRFEKRAEDSFEHIHDLRHTFASCLVQRGVDLYRVQRLLGHRDGRMTQRYAHLSPENLREAVEVQDKDYHNFMTVAVSGQDGNDTSH